MAKKRFSDQLRQAIDGSGYSRYAIGKVCGIDKGQMSRFMAGKEGLSLAYLDSIADMIGLQVILDPKKKVKHGKRSK